MRTLKVTDQLAPKYHGAGYALAAITGGQLIDIRYVMDVAPSAIAERSVRCRSACCRAGNSLNFEGRA